MDQLAGPVFSPTNNLLAIGLRDGDTSFVQIWHLTQTASLGNSGALPAIARLLAINVTTGVVTVRGTLPSPPDPRLGQGL